MLVGLLREYATALAGRNPNGLTYVKPPSFDYMNTLHFDEWKDCVNAEFYIQILLMYDSAIPFLISYDNRLPVVTLNGLGLMIKSLGFKWIW